MRAFESKSLCKLKTLYISLYIHVCSNWDDAIYDLTLGIVAFETLSLNIKKQFPSPLYDTMDPRMGLSDFKGQVP